MQNELHNMTTLGSHPNIVQAIGKVVAPNFRCAGLGTRPAGYLMEEMQGGSLQAAIG